MAVWFRSGGALLLAALAAAQLYDEPPTSPEEMHPRLHYQFGNEIDIPEEIQKVREDKPFPIILYRLLGSPHGDMRSQIFQELRIQDPENVENEMLLPTKRVPDPRGGYRSSTASGTKPVGFPRPQQKWKTKKGKIIRSQMVCYFKLCAFRSPQ